MQEGIDAALGIANPEKPDAPVEATAAKPAAADTGAAAKPTAAAKAKLTPRDDGTMRAIHLLPGRKQTPPHNNPTFPNACVRGPQS